ncbi:MULTISPECIES: IS630 family transposase [Nitrosomonas]|uniref:Transposase n=1 Tax=Nitrosomonas communis TaxID=44574 RepID=A0A0F7KEF4_9PROT|nr:MULTISPECIES: IS630 family transposase [Nitrosomonas]AKH37523.1 transposase [Nitrosomonas communis]TYP92363.1 transposase [Nitrosomonas communis]UVS62775.1 IS630 family transposase [Nitrosomonas sp. PLL12]
MSSRYGLTDQELAELEFEHRHTTDKRYAGWVKVVYLLGKGWSAAKVAHALLNDREMVRNQFQRYGKGGLAAWQRNDAGGSDAALTQHLRENLYLTAKEIAQYVEQTWQVAYRESGMTQLLHRLGYFYKKPRLIPGKANAERQKEFVEYYQTLKAKKAPDDPIYFMDATHPQHNPIAGYGWIRRGQDHQIPGNTGRQCINLNGAIDCAGLCPIIRYDDTIHAQSTIALLQQIEQQHPAAARIYVICDNARYYYSQLVTEYLSDLKIQLIFLPPYAPDLNLIGRYWRFFKKEILYGKYYQTFALFKQACDDCFVASNCYKEALRSLLTDNFQVIDCA